MAGGQLTLTRDGAKQLRKILREKFISSADLLGEILSVLDALIDGWEWHKQGMTIDSFYALNQALMSPLHTLMMISVGQARMACDQLACAWSKVQKHITWIE